MKRLLFLQHMFYTSPFLAAGRKVETTDGGLWPKAMQGKNFSRRDHMSQWRSECSLLPAENTQNFTGFQQHLVLSAKPINIQITARLTQLNGLKLICGLRYVLYRLVM